MAEIEIEYLKGLRKFTSDPEEQFVDKGFELNKVYDMDLDALYFLRSYFSERFNKDRETLFSFQELDQAIKLARKNKIFPKVGLTSATMRRLWRAGYIRRFIKGKWDRPPAKGRGHWYGVSYTLEN